jgi:hypothetical protein
MDDALAAQHLLCGLSDDRTRFTAENPWLAMWRQCHDAEQGLTGGRDFFSTPF